MRGWIVCEGATRPVVDARVSCPVRGEVMVVECLGCRLLVTSSAERTERSWCVVEVAEERLSASSPATRGKDEGGAAGLR